MSDKPANKKSKAWASLEKGWRDLLKKVGFKAKRILRGADIGISEQDVENLNIPDMKSDCKYKLRGWTHHSIFYEVEAKYVKPNTNEFLVMPTKAGKEKGFLVTLRGEAFARILAKAYLPNKLSSDEVSCPTCVGPSTTEKTGLGLLSCRCKVCNLEFLIKEINVEE